MDFYLNLSMVDIEGEIWLDIFGYEGLYKVSNFGRIKSLDKKSGIKHFKSHIRKIMIDKDGYCVIILSKLKKTYKRVHRLVAIAFIPNPENKKFVNHKKGIKTDNRVSELEWVTQSENEKHAYKNGLKKPNIDNVKIRGVSNFNSKLTESDVVEIRDLYKKGISVSKIQNIFNNMTLQSIYGIVKMNTWKNIA